MFSEVLKLRSWGSGLISSEIYILVRGQLNKYRKRETGVIHINRLDGQKVSPLLLKSVNKCKIWCSPSHSLTDLAGVF